MLWGSAPYQEDAAAVRTPAELAGAMEHLEYAIFRRYQNQLTKAERARLDNTIENALFKAERYAARLEEDEKDAARRRPRGRPQGRPRGPRAGRADAAPGQAGRPEAGAARQR